MWFRRRRGIWRVPTPSRRHAEGGGSRVSVAISRSDLWFECDELDLEPSVEAFAGLLLLPALQRRARLAIDGPVDATWWRGIQRVVETWQEWWYPLSPQPFLEVEVVESDPEARGRALCFSAGVDSFYELFRAPDEIEGLIFVHGFDIPLEDERRAADFRGRFEEIASGVGKAAVWLSSNLREHSLTGRFNWERLHGAALAATGHVMSRRFGALRIAPTYGGGRLVPWGSHPDVDPHWSSGRLAIEHGDWSGSRLDRLEAIFREPIVRRHLRVCWENLTPTGNCSRCEKCLRTRAALSALGGLEGTAAFQGVATLPGDLDALPGVRPEIWLLWAPILERDPPRGVRAALERLRERSQLPETAA